MKIAFLFPGQGSQAVGMGRDLAERFPLVAETIAEAEQVSGVPLRTLCFEGPVEALQQTENAQLAILTMSVAFARLLHAQGLRPACTAGHSLGEYSALVEAKAMPFSTAVTLVKRRGELMAISGRERPGTMAAVLGGDRAAIDALCQRASAVVRVANYNAPGQVVISGEVAGVQEVSAKAAEAGIKRVLPLKVSGAFHSPLMAVPATEFAPLLMAQTYKPMQIPVYANLDARPYGGPDEVAAKLTAQLDHPVLWEDTVTRMVADGVDTFVEVGPGQVLTNLVKRMSKESTALNVEDVASLEKTLAALGREVHS